MGSSYTVYVNSVLTFYAISVLPLANEEFHYEVIYVKSEDFERIEEFTENDDFPIRLQVYNDRVYMNDFYPPQTSDVNAKLGPVFIEAIKRVVLAMRQDGMTNARSIALHDLSTKNGFPIRSLKQIFERKLGFYEQFGFKGRDDKAKMERILELHELSEDGLVRKLKVKYSLEPKWREKLKEHIANGGDTNKSLANEHAKWAVIVFSWFKYVEDCDITIVDDGRRSHYDVNDLAFGLELTCALEVAGDTNQIVGKKRKSDEVRQQET